MTDLLTGLSLALVECIITGYEAVATTLKVEFYRLVVEQEEEEMAG